MVYVDEQREQFQQIVEVMQNDFKRMTHIFEISVAPNGTSHDIDATQDSSPANGHSQPPPINGMLMNSYSGQPQPPPPAWENPRPYTRPDSMA
jgi:hypothetical protein